MRAAAAGTEHVNGRRWVREDVDEVTKSTVAVSTLEAADATILSSGGRAGLEEDYSRMVGMSLGRYLGPRYTGMNRYISRYRLIRYLIYLLRIFFFFLKFMIIS